MHGGNPAYRTTRRRTLTGRHLLAAAAMLAVFVVPACRPPDRGVQTDPPKRPEPPPRPPVVEAPKPLPKPKPPAVRNVTLGTSVEGRPIEAIEFGSGDDLVLVMGSIHGNEPAGAPLARRLAGYFAEQPDLLGSRHVLIVVTANPDGLAKGTRDNAHGIDLNRNFPANNYTAASHHGKSALSEPESRLLHKLIVDRKPRRIISIHQIANPGSACVDYDGPAEPLARAMSAQSDLPVRRIGSKSGSLGSFAGVGLGIPTITVELPRSVSKLGSDVLWGKYGKMLVAGVCYSERKPSDSRGRASLSE
jgi:murein peptide amidase A